MASASRLSLSASFARPRRPTFASLASFAVNPSRRPPPTPRDQKAPYCFIQGFDFPAAIPIDCSRWNFPPRGGLGLASAAAFFIRSARCIGLSPASSGGWSLMGEV